MIDTDRRAIDDLVLILNRTSGVLEKAMRLGDYFGLADRYRILPFDDDNGSVCWGGIDDWPWWEFVAYPQFRLVQRSVASHEAVLLVSDQLVDGGRAPDWEELYRQGRAQRMTASIHEVVAIGVAPIKGQFRTVAITTWERVAHAHDYSVKCLDYTILSEPELEFTGNLHYTRVQTPAGVFRGAWFIPGLATPEEEHEAPPKVEVRPITAEWLAERMDGDWIAWAGRRWGSRLGSEHALYTVETTRFGDVQTLPAIIERALLLDADEIGGLLKGIDGDYLRKSEALKATVEQRQGDIRRRLNGLLERMAPDEPT